MAWIRVIEPQESEGVLAQHYAKAVRRAGWVWNIVKIMSLKPEQIVHAIEGMYAGMMHGPSGLSRAQREMIAVVVSRINSCHY